MNNTAVNICIQVFVWVSVFISLESIPREIPVPIPGVELLGPMVKVKVTQSCPIRFFVTPWTIQPLEFSRPEYWSG